MQESGSHLLQRLDAKQVLPGRSVNPAPIKKQSRVHFADPITAGPSEEADKADEEEEEEERENLKHEDNRGGRDPVEDEDDEGHSDPLEREKAEAEYDAIMRELIRSSLKEDDRDDAGSPAGSRSYPGNEVRAD